MYILVYRCLHFFSDVCVMCVCVCVCVRIAEELWEDMSVHENDETLDTLGAVGAWPVAAPHSESYRLFRYARTVVVCATQTVECATQHPLVVG
jgi:hypothetical protein